MANELADDAAHKAAAASRPPGDELDEVMRLAERLQSNVETYRLQRTALYVVAGGVAALFAALFEVTMPGTSFEKAIFGGLPSWATALAAAGIFGAVSGSIGALFAKRLATQTQRDQRALEQVVSLLQEVQSAYNKERKWSTLEQALFRIRMARFDVGRPQQKTEERSTVSITPETLRITQETPRAALHDSGSTQAQERPHPQARETSPAAPSNADLSAGEFYRSLNDYKGKFAKERQYIASVQGRSVRWELRVDVARPQRNDFILICKSKEMPDLTDNVAVQFTNPSATLRERLTHLEAGDRIIVYGKVESIDLVPCRILADDFTLAVPG